MNLHFEAGRIAQARGWTSPEVIRAEQVDQQPPGGGPTIVVADLGTITLDRARTISALIASGTDLMVVTSEPLPADVAQWLPDEHLHVLGAPAPSDDVSEHDRPVDPPESAEALFDKGHKAYEGWGYRSGAPLVSEGGRSRPSHRHEQSGRSCYARWRR